MARRGRSRSSTGSSADTIDNASPVLDGLLEPLPALPVDPVSVIDEFTQPAIPYDRRAFSLDGEPVRGTETRGHSVLPVSPVSDGMERVDRVRTAICVRRAERREVLFAKRLHRRGRGGGRRVSWKSDIKC